ncbi:MAG TPA: hypothetical protein VNJ04_14310 [Gemmatimonadaceae bacterium]|nr:hypothetical protein [Gemmatimonadaceae bacterium]
MTFVTRITRYALGASLAASLSACAGVGGLGGILGSVLGGGNDQQQQQGGELTGRVRSIDQNQRQISIQQSNGQAVWVGYDNQTQVVYQNQRYSVTSLENGDDVTARVRSDGNRYYTDYIQVNRSMSTSGGNNSNQSFEGTVRQVDRNNGWFVVDTRNGSRITVSMPYRASNADSNRFNGLRNGDYVRFYGTSLNNSRIELRQFY